MDGTARARPRLPVSGIRVRYVAEGEEAIGDLESVSRVGVFVRAPELPRAGSVIVVQFDPPEGARVDVRGEVRWSTQGVANAATPTGFGVMLHEPPKEFLEFYHWVLARSEKDSSADPPGV